MPSRAVIGRRTAPANVRPRCSWTGGVLFRRTSGRPVRADWAKLHDPVYWPYDMLAALKGPAESFSTGLKSASPLMLPKLQAGAYVVTQLPTGLSNLGTSMKNASAFAKSNDIPVPPDATKAMASL